MQVNFETKIRLVRHPFFASVHNTVLSRNLQGYTKLIGKSRYDQLNNFILYIPCRFIEGNVILFPTISVHCIHPGHFFSGNSPALSLNISR